MSDLVSSLEVKTKTVEDWLNEVSYSVDSSYVPSDFALELVNFIKLVNGNEGEENKTPVLHYKVLDTIEQSNRVVNMIHRGAAKTTLMEYLFLYLGVYGSLPKFGRVELALYVSDSVDNGVKSMRKNLQFRYENSEFLKKYIKEIKFTDIRWEFINVDGLSTVVKGFGAKTGVRGTKEQGKRPTLAVLDDLVSDEDARSPTIISAIEDTVYKAVDYALHPSRNKVIWSGTPFNAGDPLYKAVESGAWSVNVFPVCERFPCTREEFRGSWEDRFTYDYVCRKYQDALKAGKVDTFNQELMLRIMSDEDRLILDEDIQWFRLKSVLEHRGAFNFYITTDFATSEKQSADFSFISVWAYNNKGYWFWVDGLCKRQTMDKNIDALFKFAQQYRPMGVGVEVSGQQAGFISWIQDQMIQRNIFFNLASQNNDGRVGIRPITDKLKRFNVVVPLFKQKMMFFPEELRTSEPLAEMLSELRLTTAGGFKAKHDDAIDTISMLSALNAWKPSEEIVEPSKDSLWADDYREPDSYSIDSYVV